MPSKNKRYIFYYTSNELWHYNYWWDYYSQFVTKDSWRSRLMTREELVTFLAHKLNNGENLEKYLIKDRKTTGLLKYKFSNNTHYYYTWYCVKIIRNGEEVDINYEALLREIKEKAQKIKR